VDAQPAGIVSDAVADAIRRQRAAEAETARRAAISSGPEATVQEPRPAAVAAAPSAAARALARALGALNPETPATVAPHAATPAVSATDTQPPAATPEAGPEATVAAVAPGKRPFAVQGVAAQATVAAFDASAASGPAQPSDVSIEGTLRKASAAVQGRELAAAASARTADVTAPPTAAAVPDGSMRLDSVAVQAAQGGQQASIGFAPAIADTGLSREGTVAEQIVKAVRMQIRDGIGEAKLTLRPDHMGEVSVQLRVDKDRVSATLLVERSDVRAQIEGQGAALRAGLEAQGLKLEDFVVREDGERRKGSGHEGQREQSGRRRRQTSDKSFDLNDA
jgi:flagellar hook-length control protein FliK